ncbi:hypothetical protein [Chitinophaga sp. OAE865]|uniref:hypothetical protein n=1 Tax=Chitinophaga sp. OAE865 TaxID=2817898 RepID=UPI001AEB8B60
MNNSFEINYIRKCLELAEARLNRGDGSEWTTYDFEKLSEAIEEATGVMLSVTTLKRLWGKLKYTNMPATTTLNTLAQFAGYTDWREFKRLIVLAPGASLATGDATPGEAGEQRSLPGDAEATANTVAGPLPGDIAAGNDAMLANDTLHIAAGADANNKVADTSYIVAGTEVTSANTLAGATSGHISAGITTNGHQTTGAGISPIAAPRKHRKWTYWLLALLPLGILVYALLLSNTKPGKPLNTADFSFSSNKIVREGVPNSVVFNYNAAAAGKDSVFISQSWDIRRKVPVPAKENTFTTIYYTPGYFRAKLIVNKQIVKEHDLMIGSGGWLALVEQQSGTPLYFRKNEVMKGNGVEVEEALLSQYHLPLQPDPPALRFFYVQSFGDLRNDDFTFETTLKSGFRQGTAACQRVEVLILCKNDVIFIPLCAPGCVGELSLFAAGTTIDSRNTDLSKFGANLAQWVKLRVVTQNRHMQFYVNDSSAAELTFSNPPSDIVGVQYRFSGTGAVKDTRFTKNGTVIELQQ